MAHRARGLTIRQIASCLGIHYATVSRDITVYLNEQSGFCNKSDAPLQAGGECNKTPDAATGQ